MLYNTVKRFGPAKATVLFTVIIVSFCVSVTYFAVSYFDPPIQLYQLIMGVFFPVTIFFFPAIYFFNVLQRLDSTEKKLKQKNTDLEKALKEVKVLEGIFPICSSCKAIRDDDGNWNQIESYLEKKSGASFSHGLCPDCYEKLYPDISND